MPLLSPNHVLSTAETEPEKPANACLALVQQVAMFSRQMKRILASLLADSELSDTHLLLLWACADAGTHGIAQNQLAALVGLSTAQISGLVERMSRRELIAECANSDDRRRRLWRLTGEGRDQLARVLQRLDPLDARLEARLAGTHLRDLIRLLKRAGQVVEELAMNARSTAKLRPFPCESAPSDAGECRGGEAA
jgi:DNA-binding MarR family transcriptional regulator